MFYNITKLTYNEVINRDENKIEDATQDFYEACAELQNRANLSIEQLIDIFGFFGEAFYGGVNCDTGYMLGDFIDYLRERVDEKVTLHDIIMYGSGSDVAKALQQAFDIQTEEKFYDYYEGFIKKYIRDIVDSQTLFRDSLRYRENYYDMLTDQILFSRENCVQKLKCWGHAGPYACRTVNFKSRQAQGNYNLLLVPSEAMKGEGVKAVKAYVLKGDSTFFPGYLDAENNGNRSPEHAALLFTDKMKNMTLTDNYYYNAVAYYAPTVKPTVSVDENCLMTLTLDEQPCEAIKNYITGVEYIIRNNQTGAVNRVREWLNKDSKWKREGEAPPVEHGEQADITVSARWYFDWTDGTDYPDFLIPCLDDYGSPISDSTTVSVTKPDVSIDQDFYLSDWGGRAGTGVLGELAEGATVEGDLLIKVHLKVSEAGHFSLEVPSINWTIRENDGSGVAYASYMPIHLSGKGAFNGSVISNINMPNESFSYNLKAQKDTVNSNVDFLFMMVSSNDAKIVINKDSEGKPTSFSLRIPDAIMNMKGTSGNDQTEQQDKYAFTLAGEASIQN